MRVRQTIVEKKVYLEGLPGQCRQPVTNTGVKKKRRVVVLLDLNLRGTAGPLSWLVPFHGQV